MNLRVRIAVAIGILFYYLLIFILIKKRKISLKSSLIWFFWGIIFILFDAFPILIIELSRILGISVPLNSLLIVFIFGILINLIFIMGNSSRQEEKIKDLSQELALLEWEYRALDQKTNNENLSE